MSFEQQSIFSFLKPWPAVLRQVELVVLSLKRRQLSGSFTCAKATLELLRSLIGTCKFVNTKQIMHYVRSMGQVLQQASPSEFSIGNVVRRVLFIIREEYSHKLKELTQEVQSGVKDMTVSRKGKSRSNSSLSDNSDSGVQDTAGSRNTASSSGDAPPLPMPSMGRGLSLGSVFETPSDGQGVGVEGSSDFSKSLEFTQYFDMRQGVMTAINEVHEEMENVQAPIAEVALEHIHSHECVMVIGESRTVESFIRAAARKVQFHVIIVAEGTALTGHKQAASLSSLSNISVTLIPESAVYAIMSRVNKVIFSPQAVMADGGAICLSGHLMTILAAREHAVPVVGVTGVYKLTPLFSHNQTHVLDVMNSPCTTLAYNSPVNSDNVEISVPIFDYISPVNIELFVTNNGSHQPSYVYRLLSEFFHQDDYDI
mmetsp:Transcript_24950/g.42203  ORF Transcript_24950/g.42203 Transcript_24950/m.42203 type:complete len:427 (+) Transcript_24950:102-1382(+)